jgi:hypothetical protein
MWNELNALKTNGLKISAGTLAIQRLSMRRALSHAFAKRKSSRQFVSTDRVDRLIRCRHNFAGAGP